MELIEKLYDLNIPSIALILTVVCGIVFVIWSVKVYKQIGNNDEDENSPY